MASASRIPLVFLSIASWILVPQGLPGATVFQVKTVAGNGSSALVNGNGTNASFSQPNGIAVDDSGNVYVADLMNHSIRKITTNGVVTTLAGNGTSGFLNGSGTDATFCYPSAVAVDRAGSVYVADIYNHAVRRISSNGIVTTFAGKGTYGFQNGVGTNSTFDYPMGIAVDASGNVFVADTDNCAIRKITPSGTVTTLAGSGESGYSDGDGTNASFCFPQGIAVDGVGNVYVADSGNNVIRKIDTNGTVFTLAGDGSYGCQNLVGTNASFREPCALTVDRVGNVFVSDDNNVIRKIATNGSVSSIAGGRWGFDDGNSTDASFKSPKGLAVNTEGTIYVADFDNNAVRSMRSVFVKSPQSIDFPALAGVSYLPGLQISLRASASSGLPTSFTSLSSNGAVSNATLNVSGAGTLAVVASQEGNDFYDAAQPVTNTILIERASNAITFAAPSQRIFTNGDTFYLAATSLGGTVSFQSGNTNILSINGSVATVHNAGSVSIKAVQGGNINYYPATPAFKTLVINKAQQTISFNLSDTYAFKPNETIALAGTASSGLPVVYKSAEPGLLIISGTNAVMRKRGKVHILASQPGNANFLGVTNAPVTITLQ